MKGNSSLDISVVEKLPPRTKVLEICSHNSSEWASTTRISTILADGSPKQWFLKCALKESGRMMLEGEFHSMTEIYKTVPAFVPKPYAWGKLQRPDPETYFFLCEYVEMENNMPDPVQFCSRVAELHNLGKSPNNSFGFHVTTYQGKFPQAVEWDPSWQSFFTKMLKHSIKIDAQENGSWTALDTITSRVLTTVIPTLLGALESEGRTVKPSLIHGDLWDGNIGTDCKTGNLCIFDAGAYYAHNEMELGMWRCNRHEFVNKEIYLREYLKIAGISEPVEQFDDRNRLYCVYMNIWASAHHGGGTDRITAYNDMCYLVEKYASVLASKHEVDIS